VFGCCGSSSSTSRQGNFNQASASDEATRVVGDHLGIIKEEGKEEPVLKIRRGMQKGIC